MPEKSLIITRRRFASCIGNHIASVAMTISRICRRQIGSNPRRNFDDFFQS
jgi:hypothetical protein